MMRTIEYRNPNAKTVTWHEVKADVERLMNGLELRFDPDAKLPNYVKDGNARFRINFFIYTPVRVYAGPGPLTIRVLPTLFQED